MYHAHSGLHCMSLHVYDSQGTTILYVVQLLLSVYHAHSGLHWQSTARALYIYGSQGTTILYVVQLLPSLYHAHMCMAALAIHS